MYENCVTNPGVTDAMFRQRGSTETKAYAPNVVPGIVFADNYDMGKNLLAYKDNDYQNIGNTTWNSGYGYRNDGVDIASCTDAINNGFYVGWTNTGEFMTYTIDVQQTGYYDVVVRTASPSATGQFSLRLDNNTLGVPTMVPNTGSYSVWKDVTVSNVLLTKGKHRFVFNVNVSGFNINYYNFVLITAVDTNLAPLEFNLRQNYPNPFNPGTEIKYILQTEGQVRLSVYNTLGQVVDVLVDETQVPGPHIVKWMPELPAGVYFYELQMINKEGKSFKAVKKAVFLR
ncbi:MAG: carbohydrate-binding protein [Ignavibacteriales bacterium]|nr:carbohydrate-binding protein [Ignavibacteriales bacterium]